MNEARTMKVALINMPLSQKHFPSIQLAICKTVLNSVGVKSDTLWNITKSQRDVLKKCTIPIPSRQLSEYDMNELVEILIIQLEGKSLSLVEIGDVDVEIVTKRSISCKVLENLVEAVE